MVTVKATHTVRPAEPTPEEIMYLHASDQIKDFTHTTIIYFYKHSAALDATDAVSRLKDSLGKALVLFYPLAGRLSWAAEGGGRVELHCNGKGVPIIEAESEAAVEDFGDFSPTPAMQDYVPSWDWNHTARIDDMPLLILQLTKFRCGGVSVALGFSHTMADCRSALYFVDEWAKIARGGGAEPAAPPYLDRRVLDTDQPLISALDPSLLRPMPTLLGPEQRSKSPTAIAVLKLTKLELEKLRGKASLDGSRHTRFEAVAAHIWRCTSKARGHAAEQQTSLLSVADFRDKLNPPLPKHFFGNALIRVKATDNSGSLLSNSVGAAAKKIREAILEVVSDGTVRAYLDYLKRLPDVGPFRTTDSSGRAKRYTLNPNLAIVSWAALPLYGVDFGWGKEIHMGPGPKGVDGKFLILPGHDGDGGWDIVTWLQEQHMPDFKKCFYEDI